MAGFVIQAGEVAPQSWRLFTLTLLSSTTGFHLKIYNADSSATITPAFQPEEVNPGHRRAPLPSEGTVSHGTQRLTIFHWPEPSSWPYLSARKAVK